jgi:hypothetical protein
MKASFVPNARHSFEIVNLVAPLIKTDAPDCGGALRVRQLALLKRIVVLPLRTKKLF